MDQAPTKQTLEMYLMQTGDLLETAIQTTEGLIKKFKLPYKIEYVNKEPKLVEVGDSTEACLSRFITVNKEMLSLKDDVRKLALIDDDKDQLFSVLITGPTGTGKELLAKALHGDRSGKFIAVNCAGLPSELIESELFGHKANSFTGSGGLDKKGLMEVASSKGTLFLDEIGELPMSVQAKLLRAIQSREIRRVGDTSDREINCRLVAATHRDLYQMVEHNLFREDLYARITTFELHTIELANRPEDIVPLLNSMDGGKEFYEAFLKKHTSSAEKFLTLDFNVRSLQQHVKRYRILGRLP